MKSKLILLLLTVCLSACDFSEPVQTNSNVLNKDIIKKKESKTVEVNLKQEKSIIDNQDTYVTDAIIQDDINYIVSDDLYMSVSNSQFFMKKDRLLVELYLEDPPKNDETPIAILKSNEPVAIEKTLTVNNNEEEYRKVFSNNFEISFLSKHNKKALNINFSKNEYISTYPIYVDENISMLYVETKGISLRPEDYSWSSCLYLYHKRSNKIMDFYPEGCVLQDIKRTGITKKNDYERDEVYLDNVKVKDGIYTISINNIPRLQNSQFDFNKEKVLTYKFKLNLINDNSQFQLINCDYRYKKSNDLIEEHRECDYSLD